MQRIYLRDAAAVIGPRLREMDETQAIAPHPQIAVGTHGAGPRDPHRPRRACPDDQRRAMRGGDLGRGFSSPMKRFNAPMPRPTRSCAGSPPDHDTHHNRLRRRRHALAERALFRLTRTASPRCSPTTPTPTRSTPASSRRRSGTSATTASASRARPVDDRNRARGDEEKVPGRVIRELIEAGQESCATPSNSSPSAGGGGGAASDYRLLVVTKGDLLDQERKVANPAGRTLPRGRDRLAKDARNLRRDLRSPRRRGKRGMMVGNSLRSDVVPAIRGRRLGRVRPSRTHLGGRTRRSPRGSPALPPDRRSRTASEASPSHRLIYRGSF